LPVPLPHALADLVCPACGQIDRVEKASSAVRRSSGLFMDSERAFVSELAQNLSPPQPPEPYTMADAISAVLRWWLVAAVAALVLLAIKNQDEVSVPESTLESLLIAVVVLLAVFMPLVQIAKWYLSLRQLRVSWPAWERAMERWQQVYYCYRDDVIFIRGEGHGFPPDQMAQLVYRPQAVLDPVVSPGQVPAQ
jgi:hypothetical protein